MPPPLPFAALILSLSHVLSCTCVGIHPRRVEPASPIALIASRTEARRYCASSLDTFTQSFLHRAWPRTHGPEIGFRSALTVVAHVISWPLARLRHVRGGVGRRRSLVSSSSGRLAARPKQHTFRVRVVPLWNKLPAENVNELLAKYSKNLKDTKWRSLFPHKPG